MGTGSIPKLLAQLAIPAVVAQIVNLLYNIVDRIYIGHMPEIGAQALTGVKGILKGKQHHVNACIIGEMDALRVKESPTIPCQLLFKYSSICVGYIAAVPEVLNEPSLL